MTLAIHHALRTSERATRTSERATRTSEPATRTSERATQFIGRFQTTPRLSTLAGMIRIDSLTGWHFV